VLTVDDEDAGTTADTTYTYALTNPSWTDPTGTYLVTLDAFDRPVSLDEPVSTTASFTWSYRADGQVKDFGQPIGNTTANDYDLLGRPKTKITTAGGTARAAYTWTRNQAGQVLSEQSQITTDPTNNTRSFAYDPAGRLTAFSDDGGTTQTAYGWAETLNRTSVQVGAGTPVPTTYDDANRPLNQAGVANAFTSDADGQLTKRPDAAGAAYQRFTWDHLGRLTTVKGASGNQAIATYTYDPLDRLRMVDYGSNTRVRFRYAGLTTSAVQTLNDQSGAVIRNIGTGWGGELLEDWTGTNANWRIYGTNGHHDITWTAGSSGSVTGTVRYDPWGTATSTTGSVPDFRFQSSWADDTTKLSWVVTRWYAAAQGRFISEDSLLGEPRDPDSRHLYAYGEGEPVGRWDPDGKAAYRPGALQWRKIRSWIDNETDWDIFRVGTGYGAVCVGAGAITGPTVVGAALVAVGCFVGATAIAYFSGTIELKSIKKYDLYVASYPARAVKLLVRPGVDRKYKEPLWAPTWTERLEYHFVRYATYPSGSTGDRYRWGWYHCHRDPSFGSAIYNLAVSPLARCSPAYTVRDEQYTKPWQSTGYRVRYRPAYGSTLWNSGWRWPYFYR
jgi:RHS repeat-associated protein